MKPRIAIDLDGVGADFMGFVRSLSHKEYQESTAEKTWHILDKIDHLFCHLHVIPGSKELFQYVKSHSKTHEVFVLTALPRITGKLHTAAEDKIKWVQTHFGDMPVVCSNGWREKKMYCRGPQDILIDDMVRNIDDWTSVGGTGIHHTSVDTTLTCLDYLLYGKFNQL